MFKYPLDVLRGLLPTLQGVGSWLPIYLASFFPSSGEKISQRELKCHSLHSEMGTSPLSPCRLGSSHIGIHFMFCEYNIIVAKVVVILIISRSNSM